MVESNNYPLSQQPVLIPAGAGVYIKCRSNGTATTDWADLKLQRSHKVT